MVKYILYTTFILQSLPQVSSSLACARRGWVNVDADTIECEACGANLRFISSATGTPDEGEFLFSLTIRLCR